MATIMPVSRFLRFLVLIKLLFLGSWLTQSSAQTTKQREATERVSNLLKVTEFYFEGLQRSLGELNDQLLILRPDTAVHARSRRSAKRDDIGQLVSSFHAFCDNLQGEASSLSVPPTFRKTTKPPLSKEKTDRDERLMLKEIPGWFTSNLPVLPLSVETIFRSDRVVIIFTVKHHVDAYVSPFIEKFDFGKLNPQFLKLRKGGNVPKISKARFRIKTKWCGEMQDYDTQHVGFAFMEVGQSLPTTVLTSVDVCGKNLKNETNIPMTWHENIRIPQFYSTLEGSTIAGETSFEVKILSSESIQFYITLRAYDSEMKNMSVSYWRIYGSGVGEGEYSMSIHEPKSGNRSMLTVEEVLLDDRINDIEDTLSAGNETQEREFRLRLTVHPTSDSDSGVIYLERSYYNNSGDTLLRYVSAQIPIYVNGENQSSLFPDGTFSFTSLEKVACNTNPYAKRWSVAKCSIPCSFQGGDIQSIAIYDRDLKMAKRPGDFRFRSQIDPNGFWAMAYLDYIGDVPTSAAGEYICQVRSIRGETSERNVTLLVGGYPAIDENTTSVKVKDHDNETALVTCAATGSNVTIMIYADDILPEARMDNNSSYVLRVTRPASDRAVYELDVPSTVLKNSVDVVYCEAINELGQNSVFRYTYLAFDD